MTSPTRSMDGARAGGRPLGQDHAVDGGAALLADPPGPGVEAPEGVLDVGELGLDLGEVRQVESASCARHTDDGRSAVTVVVHPTIMCHGPCPSGDA